MKRTMIGVGLVAIGLALTGCSASSSSSTTTTRAKSLTDATNIVPGGAPGASSAQDVAAAFAAAANSDQFNVFCTTDVVRDQQLGCEVLSEPSFTYKNVGVGKVVTEGNRAIMNFTGTFCAGAQCVSNTDPNSAMSDGTSFNAAFASASLNSNNSTPFAMQAESVNGRWYLLQ